jgi:large subunit ribosomal protein L15
VNLTELERVFEKDAEITPKTLVKAGLVESHRLPIKILGSGKLTKKLKFSRGLKFSVSAKQAVEKAGGIIEQADVS